VRPTQRLNLTIDLTPLCGAHRGCLPERAEWYGTGHQPLLAVVIAFLAPNQKTGNVA